MADRIKKVEYFVVEVADKAGAGAAVLKGLAQGGVNLLAFTGFPNGKKAQLNRRRARRHSPRGHSVPVVADGLPGACAAQRGGEADVGLIQPLSGGWRNWQTHGT